MLDCIIKVRMYYLEKVIGLAILFSVSVKESLNVF